MADDLYHQRISVVLHTVVAVVVGFLSLYLGKFIYSFIAAIIVLIIVGYATRMIIGKKNRGWWLSNGAVIYLLIWVVSWIIFSNLLQVPPLLV